jgi:hypothetical protein
MPIYYTRLEELQQQYEAIRLRLIDAVGDAIGKEEVNQLKRQLETIASQIRKIDVNRAL